MTPSLGKVATRLAAALILAVVIIGVGLGARKMLAREAAQGRRLVDEGRRALVVSDRATAVLAFERARLFGPRSEVVRSALASADVRDAESFAPAVLRFVTAPEWAALATGSGWIAGLGLAVIIVRRRCGRLVPAVLGAGAVFAAALTALIVCSPSRAPVAVVMAGGADTLVAPYQGAAVEAPLAAGSVVQVDTTYGRFARVRAGDGHEGWVPSGSLEPILPSGN